MGNIVCEKKKRFQSQEKAQRFASYSNQGIDENSDNRILPYFCTICGGWHNSPRQVSQSKTTNALPNT